MMIIVGGNMLSIYGFIVLVPSVKFFTLSDRNKLSGEFSITITDNDGTN